MKKMLIIFAVTLSSCYSKTLEVTEQNGKYEIFTGVYYAAPDQRYYVWVRIDFNVPIGSVDSIVKIRKVELDSAYLIVKRNTITPDR